MKGPRPALSNGSGTHTRPACEGTGRAIYGASGNEGASVPSSNRRGHRDGPATYTAGLRREADRVDAFMAQLRAKVDEHERSAAG
jgi:hypothetical protein